MSFVMVNRQSVRGALALFIVSIALCTDLRSQSLPVVHELKAVTATSKVTFQSILDIQAIANGGVLVNDGTSRRVVVLDSMLSFSRVVLDSLAASISSYGSVASPLIRYLGDSVLFVDGASKTLLVIDPAGKIAHTMAAPKGSDLTYVAGAASSADAKGNLVYHGITYANYVIGHSDTAQHVPPPDSAPLMRANFETRAVDTIARLHEAATNQRYWTPAGRNRQLYYVINPVATPDEWAMMSDGSIALVRGHDYHIDWLLPDGSKRSTAKLPFDWKPLTEQDKIALKDSARKAEETLIAEAKLKPRSVVLAAEDGTTKKDPDPIIQFVPLSKMPDYYPAIRAGAVRADLDNRLWILPTTSAQSRNGELVYDVVNNQGALINRVRMPVGRSIAGFGHNNIVYVKYRDADGLWHLEKTEVAHTAN